MKCICYAVRGIAAAAVTEMNMRIHLAIAFYVVVSGLIVQLSAAEWMTVLICIALVLSAECINTAIENVCDALHPEKSVLIGKAKDMSAGAVLLCAAAAAVVGGLVFFRAARIRVLLNFFAGNKVLTALLLFSVAAWIYFIFARRKVNDD